jgi:hypothetical protein
MTELEAMKAYAAGEPVPAVDPADIKRARELVRRADVAKATDVAKTTGGWHRH